MFSSIRVADHCPNNIYFVLSLSICLFQEFLVCLCMVGFFMLKEGTVCLC